MGRALVVIRSDTDRRKAAGWAQKAPPGTRIEFRRAKRSIPQNSLLWARLTDISQQVEWYGQKLAADDWKDMFTASLRKARVVPGLDPGSFVLLGLHTSDMSKDEMTMLLDLIDAFAAERGVQWHWEEEAA
jgi:hypothetical protein